MLSACRSTPNLFREHMKSSKWELIFFSKIPRSAVGHSVRFPQPNLRLHKNRTTLSGGFVFGNGHGSKKLEPNRKVYF